ncbi:MAG: alcohol dehydrogenase catalytic domain-containing protein [Dehalococcoidales bacterium]|nr:alcohol dehydrogenase catalytic domain-containing protein [Dehalococcoidales bacterium]
MKAAVTREIGVIKYEDVPEPVTGPDQVKVKIAYCGICGTDIENLEGRFGLMKDAHKKPGGNIMGHEATGTIVEVGSAAKQGYKLGQRVAMNFGTPCGACYYCRNRMEHFCQHRIPATGSYADYAVYGESCIYPIPDDMSFETSAMLEPVTIAVHTVDIGEIQPGKSVMISGAGPIGLLTLQVALKAGASRVLVSEPVAEKREIAKKLGADVAVDPFNEDLEGISKEFTGGRLFDTVFEASGNLKAARQTIDLAGKCGIVVWGAVYPFDAEISLNPFHMYASEISIRSVFIAPYCFPRALDLLPKLDVKSLITDIFPLSEADKAFEKHKKGKSIKILLKP